jgi:hypothetical protein
MGEIEIAATGCKLVSDFIGRSRLSPASGPPANYLPRPSSMSAVDGQRDEPRLWSWDRGELVENFRIASKHRMLSYFAERVSAAIQLQDKCRVAGRQVQILPPR